MWERDRMNKMWEENKLKIFSVCIFNKKIFLHSLRFPSSGERRISPSAGRGIQSTPSVGTLPLSMSTSNFRTLPSRSFMFPTSKLLSKLFPAALVTKLFSRKSHVPSSFSFQRLSSPFLRFFFGFSVVDGNVFCGIFTSAKLENSAFSADRKRSVLVCTSAENRNRGIWQRYGPVSE